MPILSVVEGFVRRVRAWSSRAESIVAALESATCPPVPLQEVLHALDSAKRPLARSLRSEAIALKILNLLLCRHHMLTRSDIVLSRPVGLILDPINTCQMSCPGCVHSATAKGLFDWQPGRMAIETATALFHRYGPYAMQASFCNYGEPTLNLDTPRMIRMAKEYRLYTTMSSNLAHPRFRPEEWVECGLDFLIVSIDGITPEVYNVFRRNGDHELAFANLRALVEAKRKMKLRTPIIHWQFLAFEHSKHEIRAAIDIARDIGVNQLSIARPFDVSWDDPSIQIAEDVEPSLHRFDHLAERWIAENERPFPLNKTRIHEAFEAGFGAVPSDAVTGTSDHTCSCALHPDAYLMFGRLGETEDPRQDFAGIRTDGPFCAECPWPQETAQIDRTEIRHFLRAIGAFSADTVQRLTAF